MAAMSAASDERRRAEAAEAEVQRLVSQIRVMQQETHGKVTVDLEDLVDVLRDAEGFIGGKDNAAFSRLAAAAGVE